jgi:dolichol-phosphate mannosyltransferase
MLVSVVIPIFNEQGNLPELRRRVVAALDQVCGDWEVIFVNDGSRDGSPELLRRFHEEDPRLKVITLSRNFGHQPAVTAGVHHASGQCVVLIDGNLQDPPEVIPELVARWREGFEVVLAARRSRADHGLRGLGFRLFYPLFNRVSDLPDAPDAGIFGLMDRRVVDAFNRLPERNRFIPGLRAWLGFRQTAVLYDRQPRARGKPAQTLRRLMHYALDGILSFSTKPLRVATWVGFLVSLGAFALMILYLALFLAGIGRPFGEGFHTLILVMLFLGGVQLITIGILGEYVGRIYEEIKQRPLYVVSQTLGLGSPAPTDPGRG